MSDRGLGGEAADGGFAEAHKETERLLVGIRDAEQRRRLASHRAVVAQEEADKAACEVGRWEKAYADHVAQMRRSMRVPDST